MTYRNNKRMSFYEKVQPNMYMSPTKYDFV